MQIVAQGLTHFCGDRDLLLCQALNHMNLKDFNAALSILLAYQNHPQVIPYIAECRRQME